MVKQNLKKLLFAYRVLIVGNTYSARQWGKSQVYYEYIKSITRVDL